MLASMRRALSLLAIGGALGLLACGGGGDSAGKTAQTTGTQATQTLAPGGTAKPGRSAGRIPSVFVEAARVCAVGPPAKVAQNLGIRSTDSRAIATALAKGYKPKLRRAAFRGCLTALK
jgi:hypothetical protein